MSLVTRRQFVKSETSDELVRAVYGAELFSPGGAQEKVRPNQRPPPQPEHQAGYVR